eukprot:TRINITY_DN95602_c0_g1_i1.p1 TRINITY_DN95602_c0_g1~~TRINITY_DN95602_c0_g1_i1.p1  ORF type:complete len:450 (-),score=118.47 TRINITY_DN95602_c0_g1_i1:45-1394(-)
MKRPAASDKKSSKATVRKNGGLLRFGPLEFFCYYVRQVSLKQAGFQKELHPLVRDYGYPPAAIEEETVLKWVKRYLLKKVSGKCPIMKMVVMGTYQAPDQPWCFKECLPLWLKGYKQQRREGFKTILKKGGKQRKPLFTVHQQLETLLQKRYIRGIDPELIKSGKRKGTVHGYGDVGLYHAEHQTSVMPGLTHPQGLRWKLEHWPVWLEKGVYQQVVHWPDSDDCDAIRAMLTERYSRKLPEGVRTKIDLGTGREKRIVQLFGGDEVFALSAVSQALLFADLVRPADHEYRKLKTEHGLGAGCFTIRGYWMAFQRDRSFKAIDTRTFCPGFVGALKGAMQSQLTRATGIVVNREDNWNSFETQIRFGGWLYALQQHMNETVKKDRRLGRLLKEAGSPLPLHMTELEATLCFSSRLGTMLSHPRHSMQFHSAANAIGENLSDEILNKLFR